MIDELLDVARIVSGKLRLERTAVDLDQVVRAALEVVEGAAEAKRVVDRRRDRSVDRRRLRRRRAAAADCLEPAVERREVHRRGRASASCSFAACRRPRRSSSATTASAFRPSSCRGSSSRSVRPTRRTRGVMAGSAWACRSSSIWSRRMAARSARPARAKGSGSTFTVRLPIRRGVAGAARAAPRLPMPPSRSCRWTAVRAGARRRPREPRRRRRASDEPTGAVSGPPRRRRRRSRSCSGSTSTSLLADIAMPGEDGYSFIKRVRALDARTRRDASGGAHGAGARRRPAARARRRFSAAPGQAHRRPVAHRRGGEPRQAPGRFLTGDFVPDPLARCHARSRRNRSGDLRRDLCKLPGIMADEYLAIYLNDHLAGSVVALELLQHLERAYRGRPCSVSLQICGRTSRPIGANCSSLMRALQVAESRARQATAWVAEKMTMIKLRLDDRAGGEFRSVRSARSAVARDRREARAVGRARRCRPLGAVAASARLPEPGRSRRRPAQPCRGPAPRSRENGARAGHRRDSARLNRRRGAPLQFAANSRQDLVRSQPRGVIEDLRRHDQFVRPVLRENAARPVANASGAPDDEPTTACAAARCARAARARPRTDPGRPAAAAARAGRGAARGRPAGAT